MIAVVTLIVIAVISLVAVRAGATALMMTGLSWDTASFQSYSAFFGVGFTTREAELVVNHPVRRRIIRDLILVGNIGLTSAAATLVASLVQSSDSWQQMAILGTVLSTIFLLILVSRVRVVQRLFDTLIQTTLKQAGLVRAMDYELLLRIQHGFVVSEIELLPRMPVVELTLSQSRPWDRGVVILSVKSQGKDIIGIPGAQTVLHVGDVVTVYGEEKNIQQLFGTHMEEKGSPEG